jgi:OOP family OmpA-OmpF porin
MTGPTKVVIMLGAWFVYALLVYFLGLKDLAFATEDVGKVKATATEATADFSINRHAMGAKWSDTNIYTNDRFEASQKRLLDQQTDDNILEIVGFYYEGETTPESAENIGLARAEGIWKTYFPNLPEDRVNIRARVQRVTDTAQTQQGYFEAVSFKWLEAENQKVETVEELKDRILIRFPLGSAEKVYDPSVDEYLNKLAERVIQTGEQINLTGHTDNTGTEDHNMVLGMDRAKGIRSILQKKGVSANQIKVYSKGESQPEASNKTEEGRYINRRCEVRLIKEASDS